MLLAVHRRLARREYLMQVRVEQATILVYAPAPSMSTRTCPTTERSCAKQRLIQRSYSLRSREE